MKEQIADELRTAILDGTAPAGSQMPTEPEVMSRYGVARGTARDALGLLVNEGLIVARRPHGYFVRDRRAMDYRPQTDSSVLPATSPRDTFLTEQADRKPTQTIDVAIVQPAPTIARRLQLKDGEAAVVRRRIRSLDGEPYLTNDSYYPLDIAQGTAIMSPEDIAQGANRVLVDIGFAQVRAVDEITVRMPTPAEVNRLDLAPGTPIACHMVTGYTAEGRPVRVVENLLPGDRHVIIYDRTMIDESECEQP